MRDPRRQAPRASDDHGQISNFRESPERAALLRLYAEVDALYAGVTCDDSAECCHFGLTGRQPYPTAIEWAEIQLARKAVGAPARTRRRLPLADGRCPFLTASSRCAIYASRPFGCRTFLCSRAARDAGPVHPPRATLRRIAHELLDLSARFDPKNPHPRPLMSAIASDE